MKAVQAIAESDAVIVLLTNNSVESLYVQQEIGIAIGRQVLIVPLVHPALQGRSLEMLDGLEYIRFDFDNKADGASTLMGKLQVVAANAAQRDQRRELIDAAVATGALLALLYLMTQSG